MTAPRVLCESLAAELRARGWKLATAESCTGGLLASLLTDLPGLSHVFDRGFVTYAEEAKTDLLGVPIARPTMLEATALGAVFLAGLGVGVWSDTTALAAAWQQDRAFTPSPPTTALATLRSNWERAVALA